MVWKGLGGRTGSEGREKDKRIDKEQREKGSVMEGVKGIGRFKRGERWLGVQCQGYGRGCKSG